MLLLLRKILFYLLLILYFIVTPYVVLYGIGYKVEPSQGELLKTGLISAVTEPRGASLLINGKRYTHKTPAVIYGLLPGEYAVQIQKKGYEPWQKKVRVEPEKAMRLDPVILLPKNSEVEVLSSRSYKDFLPSSGGFKLFLFEGDTLATLWKIDLLFHREVQVGLKIPAAPQIRILKIFASKDSSLVLFKTEQNGRPGYWAYDRVREKAHDLTAWMPQNPDHIEWDEKHPDFVYFLKDGRLASIDLVRSRFHYSLAEGIRGLCAKHRKLYYLDSKMQWMLADPEGGPAEPLSLRADLPLEWTAKISSQFFLMDIVRRDLFQKDLLLFLSKQGALLSNRTPFELVPQGVRGFRYGETGERIVFWSDKKMGVIDFMNEEGEVVEANPNVKIIFSEGKDIQQAFWAYDDSHLLFRDKENVFLVEASGPPPFIQRKLFQAASGSRIIYHDRSHALYYLDPQTRHLLKRNLTE